MIRPKDRQTRKESPVFETERSRIRAAARWRKKWSTLAVTIIVIVQGFSAFFFVSDILSSMIGLQTEPLDWQYRELIEIGAAGGLLIGLVLGAIMLRQSLRWSWAMEQQLRAASGAFMDLLAERFETWALTPAERDVALFSIKGYSTQEIAQMRETSEGTVKAQTNAIYRKAGVSGRSHLLSLFIDDLMADDVSGHPTLRRPEASVAKRKKESEPVA